MRLRDKDVENQLKIYMDREDYFAYNQFLIKLLKIYFVNKVKENIPNFKYTTLIDLIDSKGKLGRRDRRLLERFYVEQHEEDEKLLAENLYDIYKKTIN